MTTTVQLCSANVGGDPVNGCETEVVEGSDYCAVHQPDPDECAWCDASAPTGAALTTTADGARICSVCLNAELEWTDQRLLGWSR